MAVDVASMVVGVVLSDEFPGTLRRRPVRSEGDSASTVKKIHLKLASQNKKRQEQPNCIRKAGEHVGIFFFVILFSKELGMICFALLATQNKPKQVNVKALDVEKKRKLTFQ